MLRSFRHHDKWSEHTKPLQPLRVGDHVLIQNQTGNHPKRWDKRGVVASCEGFDQYVVIVDGSRRLTRRNRKFLRRFEPFDPTGLSHRRKDKEESRQAENIRQDLTENVSSEYRTRENPPQVLPTYSRVQDRTDLSPSRALAETEAREEWMPSSDRSSFRESIEPEIREAPNTECSQSPVESPLRRSNRSNKGQTNKFKDYETNF